ncbi:mitochondrial transcription termination factorfamily protein, partial [Striga asiatica]
SLGNTRPAGYPPEKSLVVSFLVDSCGLSPEDSIAASKSVHFDTPVKPNAFLDLLKNEGFTKPQISSIVRAHPKLLLSKPEKSILPKIQFFRKSLAGVPKKKVLDTISKNPFLLTNSLEHKLAPNMDTLKKLLGTEKAASLFGRGLHFLTWVNNQDQFVSNMDHLREIGVPAPLLEKSIFLCPGIFSLEHSEFKKLVQEVKGMGFNQSRLVFFMAMHARSGKSCLALWDRCFQVYQKWGWTREDIMAAFLRHPNCMLCSEKKITAVLEFVVCELGREARSMAKFPTLIFLSMETRIVPRCTFVRDLASKGLVKQDWNLRSVLVLKEEDFVKNTIGNTTPAGYSPEKSVVVSFLVDSCGLSPEESIAASKFVHFDTPVKPNAFLDLLKNEGFTKIQISSIVRAKPRLLLSKPEKSILPKIQFFQSSLAGVSKKDVLATLSKYPYLLVNSLQRKLAPNFDMITNLLGPEKAAALFSHGSTLFTRIDLQNRFIPNVDHLREIGVPTWCLEKAFRQCPGVFFQEQSKFMELVQEVREMGFDPSKWVFLLAMHARSGKSCLLLWDRSYEVYQKWGWSREDIMAAFLKHPSCMLCSEKKITAVLEFVVRELGRDARLVARFPAIIFLSMEMRIVPRCTFVRDLASKGLVKEDWNLRAVLVMKEEDFMKKYVLRFADEAPELCLKEYLEIYEQKLFDGDQNILGDIWTISTLGNTTPAGYSPEKSVVVSFLVDSCGLSPEESIAASKLVHFDTPVKPNAFLDLLKNEGFTKPQISSIVRAKPRLLLSKPENSILPKIQFFQSSLAGVSKKDVLATFSKYPYFLTNSLERKLAPNMDMITNLLGPEKAATLFRHGSTLFTKIDIQNRFISNVDHLREIGVPTLFLERAFLQCPGIFCHELSKFRELVQEVRGMGFDPSKSVFVLAIHARSVSMEERIVPRCTLVRDLASKGLVKEDWSFSTVICIKEEDFMEKYVLRFAEFQKGLKEYLEIYEEKLFDVRSKHPRRHLDDKMMLVWIGLLSFEISTLGNTTPAGYSPEKSVVVSFLVDSCGLSPEESIATSKLVHFDTPVRPNAFLDLLKNEGFTKTQISSIVRAKPRLLLSKPENSILPKIQFFQNSLAGVSKKDVLATFSKYPYFLTNSLERKLAPNMDMITNLLGPEKAAALFSHGSTLFTRIDLQNRFIPNVDHLREIGVPTLFLERAFRQRPGVLCHEQSKFRELVQEVREMGFNPSKSMFVLAIHARSVRACLALWDQSYCVYQKWGWSKEDIRAAFLMHPNCMLCSKKKLTAVLGFVVHELGREAKSVAKCPTIIFYSMEKRIVPRCTLVRDLASKGLVKEDWNLRAVLVMKEEDFMKKLFYPGMDLQFLHLLGHLKF